MSELPNIAFTGKAGSGKSTAANALVDGRGYTRVSFAQPLKDIAAQLWGEGARTDRGLLQAFGQKLREIDPDVWANAARRVIEEQEGPVVVDDLRFPNEYHMLKELGFVVVRVTADKFDRIERLKLNGKLQDEAQLEDTSETALDDYGADYTLFNDDTYDAFGEDIAVLLGREQARV